MVRVLRLVPLAALLLAATDTRADLSLRDYRYFRALSIDLNGRPPTRDELAAFEAPSFDLDAWIDTHLTGPSYAERLRRIYMDLMRLEIGPSFQFVPPALVLRRQQVMGPDGAPMYIYFRKGQRRLDPETDGDLCVSPDKPVTPAELDAKTVIVKPWWQYADYRQPAPHDRIGPDWAQRFPGFQPVPALLDEPVRVCKEEAQTAETGTVYASGRPPVKKGLANDSAFAKKNKGRAVSCLSGTGFQSSVECGCGVGLERCLPAGGEQNDPPGFVMPTHAPLGVALPFEAQPKPISEWPKLWWSEEARRFLDRIFVDDRDVREMLTGRSTEVNGPLAQFYRFMTGATCCGPGAEAGYAQPEPLVDPGAIPAALVPEDTATWMPVADRGPHAAGILTMPIFLTKYGSRRARAHVAYSAFLCKDFVADTVKLEPSTEPDLTKRPGCSTCHQTLEPMAAYFTRVAESDWTYLPASVFPLQNARCAGDKGGGVCKQLYDPAFRGQLRGAYASPSHAEAGPAGLAAELVRAPEFAPCVVQNVAQSLLGRPLAPEDDAWKTQLVRTFVDGGYRMRGLVRAIITSPRYRSANDERMRVVGGGDPAGVAGGAGVLPRGNDTRSP